ncbi:hypothetical protein F3Y22_tig00110963pilonHSYRG00038 [Hibiscus syriacus]|uniref:Serine/threonine-protein phosphatase 2A 55 kDa regulatory subunit B n=1 Tax=Hibiscus syriacus TaxID=106335 RepID=A0A6A2Z9G8_HIBSY|nr:hypothetical protein F3Y22_tig00110963pilonHSYRG00038 [Hibiscus syriacus]
MAISKPFDILSCLQLISFGLGDGETFISADDLRINLWKLEISNQSFNTVDVKPANMEDLTEVITLAEFHPTHCNMLANSSSKGSIRLIDLRQSALCDSHAKLFEEPVAPGSRSFFAEIIASISDIKFAKDGRYILSRDYMTLKYPRGRVEDTYYHDHDPDPRRDGGGGGARESPLFSFTQQGSAKSKP